MNKVIISTDSPADVSAQLIEKYGIKVIPLHVILNGEDRLDGVNVTPEEIIENYRATKSLPSTSAIPVGEYEDYFTDLTKDGAEVVHIALSSGVSSSCRNAQIAAGDFEGVYVVDSKHLTCGILMLVIQAVKMAEKGMAAKDIAAQVEQLTEKVDTSFVLDNLEFLAKGGRCSSVTALGANILGIRPSLEMADGKLSMCKKYRGKIDKVQVQYLNERMNCAEVDDELAFFVHSPMDEAQVTALYETVKGSGRFKEVLCLEAGCTIVSHCGPNCASVILLKK